MRQMSKYYYVKLIEDCDNNRWIGDGMADLITLFNNMFVFNKSFYPTNDIHSPQCGCHEQHLEIINIIKKRLEQLISVNLK